MTVYIAFSPPASQPFTFRANVGGISLFGSVPWNHYAQRYYLQLKNSQNEVIACVPLVSSPDDYDINLALSTGSGSLVFRESTQQFEAT